MAINARRLLKLSMAVLTAVAMTACVKDSSPPSPAVNSSQPSVCEEIVDAAMHRLMKVPVKNGAYISFIISNDIDREAPATRAHSDRMEIDFALTTAGGKPAAPVKDILGRVTDGCHARAFVGYRVRPGPYTATITHGAHRRIISLNPEAGETIERTVFFDTNSSISLGTRTVTLNNDGRTAPLNRWQLTRLDQDGTPILTQQPRDLASKVNAPPGIYNVQVMSNYADFRPTRVELHVNQHMEVTQFDGTAKPRTIERIVASETGSSISLGTRTVVLENDGRTLPISKWQLTRLDQDGSPILTLDPDGLGSQVNAPPGIYEVQVTSDFADFRPTRVVLHANQHIKVSQFDGTVRPHGKARFSIFLTESVRVPHPWQSHREAFIPYTAELIHNSSQRTVSDPYRSRYYFRSIRLNAGEYTFNINAGGIQQRVPVSVKDKDDLKIKVVLDGALLKYRVEWHGIYPHPKRCEVFRVLDGGNRECAFESNPNLTDIIVPPGTYALESFCGNERREVIQVVEVGEMYEIGSPFPYGECRRLAQEAGMIE